MAIDPNRDLLPVREHTWRNGKGIYDKFDYQLLGKLSRCELEDRFLRLLDEQTHIKKLANSQEEKIKRLGTKLLRLLNEKKIGKKILGQSKTPEELELRVIELEQENYVLKEHNVLKQQLPNNNRHPSNNHRSPSLRSNHTSPLMTTRHSLQPSQSDIRCNSINKGATNEMQLQEAEGRINELNGVIKCLHDKLEILQRNLEKSCLDSRKVKVTENIELIRLQRALKQQAIQIAALQAQVKNSECNQLKLKEELTRAYKENDDALQVISLKQNEILDLYKKLDQKKLVKLQEDELKGRIDDLEKERDCLKKTSDHLMVTIGRRGSKNCRKLCGAQKPPEEKPKKCEENADILKKTNFKGCTLDRIIPLECASIRTVDSSQQTPSCESKNVSTIFLGNCDETSFLCNKCNYRVTFCKCSQESISNPEVETESDMSECVSEKPKVDNCVSSSGECLAEKMKLKRELQYLRGMLRDQTERCESQQVEIGRLMCELRMNEEKCNETLKKLDCQLKIFQCMEVRGDRQEPVDDDTNKCSQPQSLQKLPPPPVCEEPPTEEGETLSFSQILGPTKFVDVTIQTDALQTKEDWTQSDIMREGAPVCQQTPINDKRNSGTTPNSKEFLIEKRKSCSEDVLVSRISLVSKKNDTEKTARFKEEKKRFIDQKFLDSSDDDLKGDPSFKTDSFLNKVKSFDEEQSLRSKEVRLDDDSDDSDSQTRTTIPPKKAKHTKSRISSTSMARQDLKRDYSENQEFTISILSFKLELGTSLWRNNDIEMFFVDFTCLDLKGEETETPQSLPKPRSPDEMCQFNFVKSVPVTGNRKKALAALLNNPEADFIIFKVVSDSEKFDETNGECEDLGVATVSVREFLNSCNSGPFQVKVRNVKDQKEVIGILSVNFSATPSIFTSKK